MNPYFKLTEGYRQLILQEYVFLSLDVKGKLSISDVLFCISLFVFLPRHKPLHIEVYNGVSVKHPKGRFNGDLPMVLCH